ncbi:MAG: FkbM family methyltransferase, partial [Pseudomonadota bacterium]
MAGLCENALMSGMQWMKGIVHVGANVGQEVADYARFKDVPVLLVEPLEELIPQIQAEIAAQKPGDYRIAQTCCSDQDDQIVDFHVSLDPKAQASSMLKPGSVVQTYPWLSETRQVQVKTTTLDTLLTRDHPDFPINMLAIDAQGAELIVLRGAAKTLQRCDAVYVEVSDQPMYEGGCTFKQIHDFLDRRGFALFRSVLTTAGWGNAFFMRREPTYADDLSAIAARNIAQGKPVT